MIRIGTAGCAVPAAFRSRFPAEGSHLARYARVFNATEINSSFYRAHLQSTYARWAASVPEDFRFCVKMPKTITHESRLVGTHAALDAFIDQISALGTRLGCILAQLPPSFAFEYAVTESFFAALRERYRGDVAVEPRHATWFASGSTSLLEAFRCTRVAADPARVPDALQPAGCSGLEYWRLHGSPEMYRSSYTDAFLQSLAAKLVRAERASNVWCIFDNTMLGAALANGLSLQAMLEKAFTLDPLPADAPT
jgi:uncharacterized protein YecE (DUF72 family)